MFSNYSHESNEMPGWEERLHTTFAEHANASMADEHARMCPDRRAELHFIWAHNAELQIRRVLAYLQMFPQAENEEIVLIMGSQGFWDMSSPLVPQEYTDFLQKVSALCSRLVVSGVPTRYIREQDKQANVQARNEALRAAIYSMDVSNVLFFDYDQLARLDNAPQGDVHNDWHYACHWEYLCGLDPDHNQLALTSECTCQDDMNLSIWQII